MARFDQRYEEWLQTDKGKAFIDRLVEGSRIIFEENRKFWSKVRTAYTFKNWDEHSRLMAEWERTHPVSQEQQAEFDRAQNETREFLAWP